MSTAIAATGFSQETFDAFLAARDEPAWLIEMRRKAWARFQELPMPSVRDEEWMRTDIRLFKLDRFSLPEIDGHRAAAEFPVPHVLLAAGVELGGNAVSMNSHGVAAKLDPELAAKGVLFGNLARLIREHSDQLRPFFERRVVDPNQDKFSALNAACWSGGTLLYVPKNVRLDLPLHSLSAISDGGVDLGKTMVILEPGADATLLSETASAVADGGGMHCGSIELIVEQGARLRYVNLQNWGQEVWHFAHQKGHVGREGRLQWTIGALGSRLAKVNQHVAMTGPDAEVQVNGVMFTEGRQHLSYNTHQHHQAPYCKSDLLYKTALQDRSRTVWRGMIRVDREAQRTNAYQLTVHGRTAADMFRGSADWDHIASIKPYLKKIPLIGNGDLDSPRKVVDAFRRYDIDGVMIARASLAKPWLFRQAAAALSGEPVPRDPTLAEERELLLHHFELICERFGDVKGTLLMRKYACCYAQGRRGAREFRSRIVKITHPSEFHTVVNECFPCDTEAAAAAG